MSELRKLPVYEQREKILKALEENNVIVVESPTGSGKTTGIPIILYEAGFAGVKKIGITQPRRIAALNVSTFIRKQLDLNDDTVAAKMRFFDESTDNTKIKIMTDGILLEEIKRDNLLSAYSVIMIDEAHERSLNIDFSLGLLKEILKQREDFKVIISSATINTAEFSKYFDNAPIISIDGKMFDVEVKYEPLKQERDNTEELVNKIVEITQTEAERNSGDMLVFLPGEKLIKMACNAINRAPYNCKVTLYPLYSRLSREEQNRVFTPTGEGVKIVVATNIAETSITIDGIKVVIDSGLQKNNYYDQEKFTSSLLERTITKSNADQRKGRAGRTAPGVCYRLYGKKDFDNMEQFPTPEIISADLSEVVLRMTDLGIREAENFPFITQIRRENILSAYRTLEMLEAIDSQRNITEIGKFMSFYPLPPRLGRVLAEAVFKYPGALSNVCTILAFLSTKSPFLTFDADPALSRSRQKKFENPLGDLVAYLEIFQFYLSFGDDREAQKAWCETYFLDPSTMYEIFSIKVQLEQMLAESGIPVTDDCSEKEYLLCLCAGLRQFICKRTGPREYASVFADRIYISPSTLYRGDLPSYIIAGELVKTTRLYARSIAPIIEGWVSSYGLHFRKAKALKKTKAAKTDRSAKPEKAEKSATKKKKKKTGRKKRAKSKGRSEKPLT